MAKVVPTQTNGSPELVKLHRIRVSDPLISTSPISNSNIFAIVCFQAEDESPPRICFLFQECKYEWDSECKSFQAIEFPTKKRLGTYLNHKGFQEDEETTLALKKYGPNRTTMRIPSFEELFTERATAPFFVFQVCINYFVNYTVCCLSRTN